MQEYKLSDLSPTTLPLAVQILNGPYYQPSHKHNVIEMVYIRHGAGWCAVNGRLNPMFTGDLYIIPPGATHEYYSHLKTELQYVNCLFDFSIFNDNEKDLEAFFHNDVLYRMPRKFTFGYPMQQQLMTMFSEMQKELYTISPFHLIRCRTLFIELVIQIIRNSGHAAGIETTHIQKHLGRVLGYINEHLAEKLSLAKLAALSGYAPDYFGKLFRNELGTGISEYIRNRRMELACYKLANSAISIEDIAIKTGFFDASYFIKKFKKYCGMTPMQFRKKHEQECQHSLRAPSFNTEYRPPDTSR